MPPQQHRRLRTRIVHVTRRSASFISIHHRATAVALCSVTRAARGKYRKRRRRNNVVATNHTRTRLPAASKRLYARHRAYHSVPATAPHTTHLPPSTGGGMAFYTLRVQPAHIPHVIPFAFRRCSGTHADTFRTTPPPAYAATLPASFCLPPAHATVTPLLRLRMVRTTRSFFTVFAVGDGMARLYAARRRARTLLPISLLLPARRLFSRYSRTRRHNIPVADCRTAGSSPSNAWWRCTRIPRTVFVLATQYARWPRRNTGFQFPLPTKRHTHQAGRTLEFPPPTQVALRRGWDLLVTPSPMTLSRYPTVQELWHRARRYHHHTVRTLYSTRITPFAYRPTNAAAHSISISALRTSLPFMDVLLPILRHFTHSGRAAAALPTRPRWRTCRTAACNMRRWRARHLPALNLPARSLLPHSACGRFKLVAGP